MCYLLYSQTWCGSTCGTHVQVCTQEMNAPQQSPSARTVSFTMTLKRNWNHKLFLSPVLENFLHPAQGETGLFILIYTRQTSSSHHRNLVTHSTPLNTRHRAKYTASLEAGSRWGCRSEWVPIYSWPHFCLYASGTN